LKHQYFKISGKNPKMSNDKFPQEDSETNEYPPVLNLSIPVNRADEISVTTLQSINSFNKYLDY
jgi:hypothetical protein